MLSSCLAVCLVLSCHAVVVSFVSVVGLAVGPGVAWWLVPWVVFLSAWLPVLPVVGLLLLWVLVLGLVAGWALLVLPNRLRPELRDV